MRGWGGKEIESTPAGIRKFKIWIPDQTRNDNGEDKAF
jgi:hypothetical protein